MSPGLSPLVGAALGALGVLLVVALVASTRSAWRRHRGRSRLRRAMAGEERGRALLERAGWQVTAAQPPGEVVVTIDGDRTTRPVSADYLCQRRGRTVPAEVKTGRGTDPATRHTRRQLLEYALAYDADATLLVNADAGTVQEVTFPDLASGPASRSRRAPRPGWGLVLVALLVGVLAGLAGGQLLHPPPPPPGAPGAAGASPPPGAPGAAGVSPQPGNSALESQADVQ